MSYVGKNSDGENHHGSSAHLIQQSGGGISSGNNANTITTGYNKNSLRNTKLARRARSFKDDFLEKISQIRTPTNTLGRSHSPNSSNIRCKVDDDPLKQAPMHDLNYHVKQLKHALTHFKDVISKKKLEMLPGNGTVVIESIANIHTALQSYTLNKHSSALISATTQVYLALGKFIKLCDDVHMSEKPEKWAEENKENVAEVVELVEMAVNNLVKLANDKLSERDQLGAYATASVGDVETNSNTLQRPTIDVAGQRTSLPDIPLTPRERDILQQTSTKIIRASHSTESILRDSSPPPKPPLPDRNSNPPPLPPKRRSQPNSTSRNCSCHVTIDCEIDPSMLTCGMDNITSRISLRSKSPDDNSSLLSSCSLDSALNQSRDDNDLKSGWNMQPDQGYFDDEHQALHENIEKIFEQKKSSNTEDGMLLSNDCIGPVLSVTDAEVLNKNPRNSNESGFLSMNSVRASMQSVSKHLSAEQNIQQFNTTNIGHDKSIFNMRSEVSSAISASNSNSSTFISSSQAADSMSERINRMAAVKFQHGHQFSMSSMHNLQSMVAGNNLSIDSKFSEVNSLFDDPTGSNHRITKRSLNDDDVFVTTINDSINSFDQETPPALPIKTRTRSSKDERHLSQYDNVEERTEHFTSSITSSSSQMFNRPNNLIDTRQISSGTNLLQSKHQSLIEPRRVNHFGDIEQPPPLPVKKKHIMAYMEMFGKQSGHGEFTRHSVHTYNSFHTSSEHISNFNRNITHSQTMSLAPLHKQILIENDEETSSGSGTSSRIPSTERTTIDEIRPALPPKRQRSHNSRLTSTPSTNSTHCSLSPSSSPILTTNISQISTQKCRPNQDSNQSPKQQSVDRIKDGAIASNGDDKKSYKPTGPLVNTSSRSSNDSGELMVMENLNNSYKLENNKSDSKGGGIGGGASAIPDNDNNDYIRLCNSNTKQNTNRHGVLITDTEHQTNDNDEEVVLRRNLPDGVQTDDSTVRVTTDVPLNLIEELDVSQYLVLKKVGEDGPDVKGGFTDALIVHASRVQKISDNAFGEAFITTYRTFIQPLALIEKLTHRYTIFCCHVNDQRQKAAKESFSLLVRVVNDLTAPDITAQLLSIIMEFVYQLFCSGQLMMGKLLRTQIIEKILACNQQKGLLVNPILSSLAIITSPPTLLELKSADIAEQMTLLDSELFQRIEIPEVLIWAQEQCEERSPNLTRFTEHFNKMSFWARSQILKQEDAKDREKHVIKFIKIMKHLRKINNYNSYLALLSAIDSAPIRRLEWHKTITEGLKEYCALIDSSSSFRAYRQALAETSPPCIPYIGLILQDLTFVHIGNQDFLNSGVINFSKRWQQHNIVVNMKRFKKFSSYPFRKSERIIGFFDRFENYLDEDAMWQISERIKPRISRKLVLS